jgi:hypothetical protein
VGVNAEYWYMFTDDYALAIQGNFGFYTETWEPGTAGAVEPKYTSTSYKVRLGGDRVGKIGDRFTWFMGPGLEFWSGKGKFENFDVAPNDDLETESTMRFGVSGRFGGIMQLTDAVGIQGQIGHTFGLATVKDGDAKTTWWPNSYFATWGLAFTFGGE